MFGAILKHEGYIKKHAAYHSKLADMLSKYNPKSLPKHVDPKKLEEAYKMLENYEFVLRKKKGHKR